VEKAEGERLITASEATTLSALSPVYTIEFGTVGTVAERIAGATETEQYPTDWVLEAGINPNDLVITHNLGRYIVDCKIYSLGEGGTTLLWFNEAYSGLGSNDLNSVTISNLATIATSIIVYLIFA